MVKEEYKILELMRKTGKIMLENGSEINKIEKATTNIGKNFNYKASCFATLTCLIITITNNLGEVFSLVDRIEERSTNLNKVHRVDILIKNICDYSYEEYMDELDKIEKEKDYTPFIKTLGYTLGVGFFVFLFNGGFHEFLTGLCAGAILSFTAYATKYLKLNSLFSNVIFGMISALVPSIFVKIGFIEDAGTAIISALMINVPGVSFINSIRDLFAGDLVSSLSRLLEVILIGMALSIGSGIILKFFII